MLQIPAQLTNQFTTYIGQKGIPADQHRYYLKWMRFYLAFCHKYHFEQGTNMSLSAFLKKARRKETTATKTGKTVCTIVFCMCSILEDTAGCQE